MKRLLLIPLLMLCALVSKADVAASVFSLSPAETQVKPGEKFTLAVNLQNDTDVPAFSLKIDLPKGISFQEVYDSDSQLLGNDEAMEENATSRMKNHSIIGSVQSDGTYMISVQSLKGKLIAAGSGELFPLLLQADEDADLGDATVTLKEIKATEEGTGGNFHDVPLADATAKVTIYKLVSAKVVSEDDAMGTVEGGVSEVATGTEVTVKATPATGYEFKEWVDIQNSDMDNATFLSTDNPYTFNITDDMTIVGKFEAKTVTLTFIVDGETVQTGGVKYGEPVAKPKDPTKEGHTFAGWDPEVPETAPAEDMTFTAKWTVNKYNVTFLVDGEEYRKAEVEYGKAIEKPADPEKEGHTFTGWDAAIPETMPASDLTFNAQFTVNQYTVTFVLGNGDDDYVVKQDYGTELTKPEAPTWEGHTFTGWDKEVPATIPAEDLTITAEWTVNKYNVTFLVDGEEYRKAEVEYGQAIEKPANPEKEGYTFTGWDAAIPETMPASDLTFNAVFTVNQYTMTFVLGNGDDDIVITQDYGTTLTAPADPTWEGHDFLGWNPAVPATIPAENTTFTAQWDNASFTVTFIADGETISSEEVEFGATITVPADPEKEGYTFEGWDATIPATMPANDLTFNAVFSINQYTLTFKPENGEADIVITQDYGTAITAPADPEKEGYTFDGWDDEVPATMPAADKTITAQWTVIEYTIAYNLDGGTVANANPTTYTIESDDIVLSAPTKEGHTFTGWTGTGLTDATTSVTIAKGSTGNRSYTANWTVNQYTMTFMAEGQVVAQYVLDFGSTLTAPDAPEKEDYDFIGWDPEVPATVPAEDMTFNAVYSNVDAETQAAANQLYDELQAAYGLIVNNPNADEEEVAKLQEAINDGWALYYSFIYGNEVSAEELNAAYEALLAAEEVFELALDNPTTGINAAARQENAQEGYNLRGQRVGLTRHNSQQKGIYIINGKKVVK